MSSGPQQHELEQFIGLSGIVEGKWVEVVEVLLESQELILRELEQRNERLENQYGEPGRSGHKTYRIPLLSSAGDRFHPVIETLLKYEE